jgi:hypothetical protein
MCLVLYLNAGVPLTERQGADFSVQRPRLIHETKVRKHLHPPFIYELGSYEGCGCGFPHVLAEEVIEFYEELFDGQDEREEELRSVTELFRLIDTALQQSPLCILYPIWDGNEGLPVKGKVFGNRKSMQEERFLLTEQLLSTIER